MIALDLVIDWQLAKHRIAGKSPVILNISKEIKGSDDGTLYLYCCKPFEYTFVSRRFKFCMRKLIA
jgi:hypothetical protein